MIDILANAQSEMGRLGIPQPTISILADVKKSPLSAMFNRQRQDNAAELRIDAAIKACKQLAEACSPIPVDFAQSAVIEEILQMMRSGDLTVVVVDRQSGEYVPRAVTWNDPRRGRVFFTGQDERGIGSDLIESAAVTMTFSTAREIVKRLTAAGFEDVRIVVSRKRIKAYEVTQAWTFDEDSEIFEPDELKLETYLERK